MGEQFAKFSVQGGREIHDTVRRVNRDGYKEQGKPRKPPNDLGGEDGCESQNTIWDVTIFGAPTSGSWTAQVTVNGITETITFQYNDNAVAFAANLATHSEIADIDIRVTAGPLPNATMRVEFIESLANTLILPPTVAWGSFGGGTGRGIMITLTQRGH